MKKKILTKESIAKVPVLVLTSRRELNDFFKDMKVEAFVSKPFEIKDLIKEIDNIIVKHDSGFKPGASSEVPVKESIGDLDAIIAKAKAPPKPHDPTGMAKMV